MPYTDTLRTIQLTTPLGANKLIATSFQGREAISELFFFHLDTMTEATDVIAFDSLLGQNITVTIVMAADAQCAEPDFPAKGRSRHFESGLRGYGRGLSAHGHI